MGEEFWNKRIVNPAVLAEEEESNKADETDSSGVSLKYKRKTYKPEQYDEWKHMMDGVQEEYDIK